MSGNHPARAQQTHVVGGKPPAPYSKKNHRMMPPWYRGHMPAETVTIAEALKTNGYTTGHSGKWHMAIKHNAFPQPKDQGFDWTRSDHGTTKRMRPHRLSGFATDKPDDPYRLDENGFATHQLSVDALTFVEEHKDKPFFLYYATKLVHAPIHTRSERLLNKYCEKLGVERPGNPQEWKGEGQTNPFYCAMVEELDYYVGQMFDYLETTEDPRWPGHKLIENTYVIFTSDNGGMERMPGDNITDNYPLDRGKISAMEGGTRVPLIIAGPGIEPGVQSDVMINGLDFYPTILSWTATEKPAGKQFDGCDISKLLKKDPTNPKLVKQDNGSVRDTMLWHFPNSLALESTIRVGDYKLVRNYDHVDNPKIVELELYRLYETKAGKQVRSDIEEAKNLADAMPQKAQEMNTKLAQALTEMKASYPHYNPQFKSAFANKEKAPSVLSMEQNGDAVELVYEENGAKVAQAQLIYTVNGGEKGFHEEWFYAPATVVPGNKVSATLPAGTTHYVVNLIDENNFLVSYPDVEKATRTSNPSATAQAVSGQPPKRPKQGLLKIYYIRHAEGGHNVKADWEYRRIPQDQWPAYVGNANMFTPKGLTQQAAVSKKLKPLNIDFVAVSSAWRCRNTVLPFLIETNMKAEIWPELHEMRADVSILSDDLPVPAEPILGAGHAVELPAAEALRISIRKGGENKFKVPRPGNTPEAARRSNAAARVVVQRVLDMIQNRFGRTNQTILLSGHGSAGKALLRMLTKNRLDGFPGISNTGIWMAEEQANGEFKLMMFNGFPVEDGKPSAALKHASMDTNGDGRVTRAEYVSPRASGFRGKDGNKDGVLSLSEYTHSSFKGADSNKDDQLTPKEFASIFEQQFDRSFDKNNDGLLTIDELQ